MKNKIITSEGNIQFIDSEGKVINISPSQVYSMINEDTVSFLLVHLPKSSGLSLFTTKVEDLELNGATYSQSTIADALAEAFSEAGAVGRIEVVDELPSEGKTNTIYLLPKDEGEGYDEYIYIKDESKWELIGDTSIEIKNYLKKSDFNEYSAATKTAIDSKQDTLIAGEHISISGNVISAEAGNVPYDGYSYIKKYEGNPWELDKIDTPFYIAENRPSSCIQYKVDGSDMPEFGCFRMDYTEHTVNYDQAEMADYISVVWDNKCKAFKVDTLDSGVTVTYADSFGYAVDVIPSGTTNETFDNLTSYVLSANTALNDADTALNNKFSNYMTTDAIYNNVTFKQDNFLQTYTINDFYKSKDCGFSNKLVSIQNGYQETYAGDVGFSRYSPYYITNVYKGILRESFPFAFINIWHTFSEETKNDIINNNYLQGKTLFTLERGSYWIYFKTESYSVTSGDTTLSFEFNGHMYHDEEFTIPYRSESNSSWHMSGELDIASNTLINSYFNARQLELDGFFNYQGSSGAASIYDTNGNSHAAQNSIYFRNFGGFTYPIFCITLNSDSVRGDYHLYLAKENCISTNRELVYSTSDGIVTFKTKINASVIDYEKLEPFDFYYKVDEDSTDNYGAVGWEWYLQENITASTSDKKVQLDLLVDGNSEDYTLGEYNASTKEITYYDNGVEGIYSVEVLENGKRLVMADKKQINKHTVMNIYGDYTVVNEKYYVHYAAKPTVTNEDITTWNAKIDTSAITTSVTSASTDNEIPTAKAVFDVIPTVTDTITSGSTDAVSAGAVYDAIGDIETLLRQI